MLQIPRILSAPKPNIYDMLVSTMAPTHLTETLQYHISHLIYIINAEHTTIMQMNRNTNANKNMLATNARWRYAEMQHQYQDKLQCKY